MLFLLKRTLKYFNNYIYICNLSKNNSRDVKMYKRANNACVNFFLAWVKYVPNCRLFCRKSELCCDFTLFGVIIMAFNLVNLNFCFKKRNK